MLYWILKTILPALRDRRHPMVYRGIAIFGLALDRPLFGGQSRGLCLLRLFLLFAIPAIWAEYPSAHFSLYRKHIIFFIL